MELRQIFYVLEVAKQKNFTKAAKALFVSQSNVSQQISSLEAELNTTIFVRDHHNVELTPEGEKFCKYAKIVVDSVNSLMQEFDKETGSEKVIMNIGVFPFAYNAGVSLIIRYFFKTTPNVVGAIRVVDNYMAYEGLDSGDLSFAIIKLRPEDRLSKYKYIPLIKEELLVILSRQNPIASHKLIDSEDLSNLPVLVGEKATHLYADFERIYKERNAEFNIVLENTFDKELLIEMLSNDEGITFATKTTAVSIADENITYRPLEEPVKYNTYLVYRKETEPKGIRKAFVDYLTNGIKEIQKSK